MSKFVGRATANVTSQAASAAVDISDLENCTVTVTGTFVGTVAVEYSHDGTEFVAAAAALTTPGTVTLPVKCKSVRLNCTAFTSGTMRGRIGGRDAGRRA